VADWIFMRLCVNAGVCNVYFSYKSLPSIIAFGLRVSPASLTNLAIGVTHVCVLKVLFRTHCFGQFESGVFNHHKFTRPFRISAE
jgi:hypothetical protein